MADVEISYNNSVIASLNDSGTEVLETNGTFLTDDITVAYTKSGGGGASDINLTIADPSGAIATIYKPTTANISFNYPTYSGTVPAKSMICCKANSNPNITGATNVTYEKISAGSRPTVYLFMIYLTDQDGTITFG